jgi:hypothetical protein
MVVKVSYEQLINFISKNSGWSAEEIQRRVDAKKARFSDLISREGAAQIVAAELGISLDKQKVKISELLVGMRNANVVGKVIKIEPIRTFKKKTSESKVCSLLLGDETTNIRVVLWDTNHIKLIEESQITEGSVIGIKNGSVRGDDNRKELHLGSASNLSLSEEKIENVISKETVVHRKISDIEQGNSVNFRATVVQAFEPRFFTVCPECNMKISQDADGFYCPNHGRVAPKNRALSVLVADDGTANVRVVCFSEMISKIFGIDAEELKDNVNFLSKKQDILGKEFLFSGRARQNQYGLEVFLQEAKEVGSDELIDELSKDVKIEDI